MYDIIQYSSTRGGVSVCETNVSTITCVFVCACVGSWAGERARVALFTQHAKRMRLVMLSRGSG
jgi:hypothetical protein